MRTERVRAALLSILAVGCAAGDTQETAPERIVFIVIDTLRRDQMSLHGGPARTPHIERVAQQGVALDSAVASFHQTSMSMGALFTGRTPSLESGVPARPLTWNASNWCGMARFASDADDACLPFDVDTLGEWMRRRGYWSAGIASNPLTFRPAGFDRGFHEWVEVQAPKEIGHLAFSRKSLPLWCAQRAGTRVNAAAFEVLTRRPHDHFFLYVHYMDAHDWYDKGESYGRGVERADAAVGALMAHLDGLGLLEGAAVLITGDHGEVLDETHGLPTRPRHQGNPSFEPVLRVPLVAKGFDLEPGAWVRSEDVPRLLKRAVGLPDPGSQDLRADEVFVTERAWRTYRSGRWKSFWRRDGDVVFLVDLHADPGESLDVRDSHPEVVEMHRRRVAELSDRLAARDASAAAVSAEDHQRLQVLGYVE